MFKKIIIGNWKMNPPSSKEAEKLLTGILKSLPILKKVEVVVCPPFLYIEKLKKISQKISLGGQNAFGVDVGAYTGEVSPRMLYNSGARYVILGHSERRTLGENNADINKKIKAALSSELTPVVCIGESIRDESHSYFNLIKTQLEECLQGVSKTLISKIIIAYEPVWAISTTPLRKDATPGDSLEMAIFIRKILFDKFGAGVQKVRVIYGGSVNENDAVGFLKDGGVDGLLPGRASLDVKKFTEIIRSAESFAK